MKKTRYLVIISIFNIFHISAIAITYYALHSDSNKIVIVEKI